MNLERCFACNDPVLELDGQFASFAPYLLRAPNEAPTGHVHLSCLVASEWGPFWAARRIEQLRAQHLRSVEQNGITILDNPGAGERIGIRSDGMMWSWPVARNKRRAIAGGVLVDLEEEWNLSLDASLAQRIRSELEEKRRSSLLSLAEALGIRARLIEAQHLEGAHLAYERELARLWKGDWVSATARYAKFIPDAAL